ncbi:MAG: YcbK family protein, partial [Polyangia bacterium]
MCRALAASLTLVLVSGLARAQAPALPTPPPAAATPSGAAATPPPATTTAQPATTTPKTTTVPKVATKRRRKTPPPPPPPAVEMFALNTHESFKLRPDLKGRLTRAALRGWNRFLRCHHTGRVHAMSLRLAQLIYDIDKHFGFKRILVVAGYRAPRVAKEKGNPKSPHKKGVACDFRIDGVPNTELRDYERTLPKVGVGYYPNSDFVHLDCDPLRNKRPAFWIDYSKPGERARYSKNAEDDLQAEKA